MDNIINALNNIDSDGGVSALRRELRAVGVHVPVVTGSAPGSYKERLVEEARKITCPETIRAAVEAAARPHPAEYAVARSLTEKAELHAAADQRELSDREIRKLENILAEAGEDGRLRLLASDSIVQYDRLVARIRHPSAPLWKGLAQSALGARSDSDVLTEKYELFAEKPGMVVDTRDDVVTIEATDGTVQKYPVLTHPAFDTGCYSSLTVGEFVGFGGAVVSSKYELITRVLPSGDRKLAGCIDQANRAVTVVARNNDGWCTLLHEGWAWPSAAPFAPYARSIDRISQLLPATDALEITEEQVQPYLSLWQMLIPAVARQPDNRKALYVTRRINRGRGVGFSPVVSAESLHARADELWGPMPPREVVAYAKAKALEAKVQRHAVVK